MPGLVVGDDLAFFLADHAAAALRPRDDAVDGLVELWHRDLLLAAAGGQDRGLVDEVREVGAGEAGRLLGDHFQVHSRVQWLALRVHFQDRLAALDVRPVEHDLAVEAAGPKERRVQDVGPVRGRDDDHVRVRVEAVHLDQDLVQRLLTLVVAAAEAGATLAADRVDLVDEDDAGRVALGLVEEVAHAGRADTDEHLDELRAGDREERHARLARDGLGEQRLACAGRPDEQHALRDACAQGGELLRVLEELDDFF